MRAGLSFSRSPISLLLRQPLSIKKSYAGAIQSSQKLGFGIRDPKSGIRKKTYSETSDPRTGSGSAD
jgi:hypothetical protein